MSHDKKHPHPHRKISGEFRHLIFSPKGGIEGLMMKIAGAPAQFVVEPGQGDSFAGLKAGQTLEIEVAPQKPSPKGAPQHALHRLHRLLSIDGRKLVEDKAPAEFSGVVERFNFARHGEPNGVVLESGDFIHLRPEGMAACCVSLGDRITAKGDARPLCIGAAHVVEAREVNGRKLESPRAGTR